MTFSTLILLAAGRKISTKDRIMVQEGYSPGAAKDFKSLIKNIFTYTMAIELAGCLSLFLRFQRDYSRPKALYFSLFHSISAFCNAGFSLFSDNLMSYRKSTLVNITVILLIILGGLGFFVLREGMQIISSFVKRQKIRVTLHSKLVLSLTLILIFFSFAIFLFIEDNQALKAFTLKEKILASLFQVVTARTAGFNTIDLTALSTASAFLLILLMFIGASPGSTGGGVKTSTIGVLFAFVKSKITARDSVSLFRRTLPADIVTKAFTVISLALIIIFLSSFILFLSQPEMNMKNALFEVFSAFGTVGLSLGITSKLSALSKIVIVLTMYIGRIGPLTLLYALSQRKALGRFEYVEERVMIG
jgi:trk system potassium uptake protein TrkH